MRKFIYNTEKFNFQQLIQDLYLTEDLTQLHELFSETYDVGDLGNDTHTIYHKMFYQKLHQGWDSIQILYHTFIRDNISTLVDEDFLYQKFPSYRIQLPNNKAVSRLHCDSDADHAHPPGELNFILPLTEMKNTNAVWVESEPNKEDFYPMEGTFGELIWFDGNTCRHFNKINEEGKTRISMDFRVLPMSKYDPNYSKQTATSGLKFIEGSYYQKFTK